MATTNFDALELDSGLVVGGNVTIGGTLTATGALSAPVPVEVASANGTLAITNGAVPITKASAIALTIPAPTRNGLVLYIFATTAHAHVVTVTGGYNGTANTIGTFGGAIGDGIALVSYNSKWYVVPGTNLNVTLSS